MSENALAIYEQFDTMQRVAIVLHESGYFSDVKSKAQAIIKVMAGAELGLPPFASMTGIHIIQGKPTLGANVIATLVKNDPRYDYRVREMTDKVCRIEFFEGGVSCGVSEFTAQDAKAALTKNMDKFPKNMLFARAMSNGAKWFTPGIFGGAAVYTPEELGADTDEDGNVIEGSYTPSQQLTVNRSPAPLPPVTVVIPPGVNPETGELNTKPPQEMTWEELNNAPRFAPNTEVMARGKREELPGVVVRDDGGATVTVRVNGKEYQFGRDKLTPIPQQPALIDTAPEPPTGYQE